MFIYDYNQCQKQQTLFKTRIELTIQGKYRKQIFRKLKKK